MHGTVSAVSALQKTDLIIALGARFDDRVTGKLSSFAPHALVVHADIDPAEISKNRMADVPIVGDCKEVITQLAAAVRVEYDAGHRADLTGWWAQVDSWRTTYPLGYEEPADGSLPRSMSSSGSVRSPAPRRSTSPASATPDVGRSSSSTSTVHVAQLGGAGTWATRSRPPWAPRVAGRRRRSGRSTATAASR
jgi:thiamine pyrophosphate-dependent acetolactate synthase large subunit-like protein